MTVVDDFQAQTEGLTADTQRAVLAVYAELVAGQIDNDAAVLAIAAIINNANAAAVTLGDIWLALQIEASARQPVTTIGVLPVDDSERLTKAAVTVLAEPDTAETRLTRLARAEPLEAAHQGTYNAMQKQPLVEGWVRAMDADPCQLCRWWSRDLPRVAESPPIPTTQTLQLRPAHCASREHPIHRIYKEAASWTAQLKAARSSRSVD